MTAVPKPKKKTKLSHVKDGTWEIFSIYIRIRDGIRTTGNPNNAICVTCKKKFSFDQLDAGHFLPGRGNAILFDVRGCHAQCKMCNNNNGCYESYFEYMKEVYGKKTIEDLESLKGITRIYYREKLMELRKKYKNNIKALLDECPIVFDFRLPF